MHLSSFRFLHEIGSVCLFGILIRWMVSINPYSGKGKPPMFGDFEAQRHWMEVTYNLPVSEWYHNTSRNNLTYWGLDYPPLTAYHSWICGFTASLLNSSWIALPESQGIETPEHKLFMRVTAIIADILIYIPAICALVYQRRTFYGGFPYIIKICQEIAVALLAPAQILIDHGHFQYNCVSLGLIAWAVFAINRRQDVLSAVLFSLALNYKHMSLYLALPFFFYLLGRCREAGLKDGLKKLTAIGAAVVATFALCWLPFIWDRKDASQVLLRLFPFSRGIFEDKVANVWCALNVVVKLQRWNVGLLATVSGVLTLTGSLISGFDLLRNPNDQKFKYALVNGGLVFFLLSFQVHEKGILLAALPATLLLTDEPKACTWFLTACTFSMFPLLLKDGLAIPTFALVAFFLTLSYAFLDWKEAASPEDNHLERDESDEIQQEFVAALMIISVTGFVILSAACQFAPIYPRWPDLWTLLLSVYSCGHFILFLVYFHIRQFGAEPILLKPRPKTLKAD
ncbi:Dolichyl pyrophosphate Man9GlcNAc2 alpha-1,3-glucosyltransferase [Hypsibius exemplaris]|uniref:Alpha-1,3-glucosyltransferase n=1 Tax=Hypsibius exemplaris TaxID=2072580 RepID=A0A1W0W849_HYPEX|nr:Dolichyl pyrophosphate Man9GlcNAc2 alpha-1,3-glucosyltransferase [Hypsibius exemplaris]